MARCQFTDIPQDWCAHCLGHQLAAGTPLVGDKTTPWLYMGDEQ